MKLHLHKSDFKKRTKPETHTKKTPWAETGFRILFTVWLAVLAMFEALGANYTLCILGVLCAAGYWFWLGAAAYKLGAKLRGAAGPGPTPGKGCAKKIARNNLSHAIGSQFLACGIAFGVLAFPIGVLHKVAEERKEEAKYDEARRIEREGVQAHREAERLISERLKKVQLEQERAKQEMVKADRARAEAAEQQDQALETVVNLWVAAHWKDISLGHLKDSRHGRDTAWSLVYVDSPSRKSYGLKIIDPIKDAPAGEIIADFSTDELEGLLRTLENAEEWAAQSAKNKLRDGDGKLHAVTENNRAESQVIICKNIGDVPLLVVNPPFGNLFLGMDQEGILKTALAAALAEIKQLEGEAIKRAVAAVKTPGKGSYSNRTPNVMQSLR